MNKNAPKAYYFMLQLFIALQTSALAACEKNQSTDYYFSEEMSLCVSKLYQSAFNGLSVEEEDLISWYLENRVYLFFGVASRFDEIEFSKVALTFNYEKNYSILFKGIHKGSEETNLLLVYLYQRDPTLFFQNTKGNVEYVEKIAASFINELHFEINCLNFRSYISSYHDEVLSSNYEYKDLVNMLADQIKIYLNCINIGD